MFYGLKTYVSLFWLSKLNLISLVELEHTIFRFNENLGQASLCFELHYVTVHSFLNWSFLNTIFHNHLCASFTNNVLTF